MKVFSKRSLRNLEQCHPDLQKLLRAAIADSLCPDFSVICGYRGPEAQNKAFAKGFSKLRFPRSKHNKLPSLAADLAPWPIDWHDRKRFIELGRNVVLIARRIGIDIRWGGDWDGDGDVTDERFSDLPHFELEWRRDG